MPVGDSITNGNETGLSSSLWFGYRVMLQELFGFNVYDFVGPYNTPTGSTPFDKDHAGLGGDNTSGVETKMPNNLTTYFPSGKDYSNSWILLHIGTNDCQSSATCDDDPSPAVDNIEDIIDLIVAHNPSINILVALIIPANSTPTINARIEGLNVVLKTKLDTMRGLNSKINYVDMNAIFKDTSYCPTDYTTCMSDTVHPNSTYGFPAMARGWKLCMENPTAHFCNGN